jgi:hypothetical protein
MSRIACISNASGRRNTRSAARAFGAKVGALARVHRARLSGFRQAFVGFSQQ